jgi:hypothetical protein
MIRHASKSAPARPSIQSILSGIRDKSTSTHRTLEFEAVPLGTYRASSFPIGADQGNKRGDRTR